MSVMYKLWQRILPTVDHILISCYKHDVKLLVIQLDLSQEI